MIFYLFGIVVGWYNYNFNLKFNLENYWLIEITFHEYFKYYFNTKVLLNLLLSFLKLKKKKKKKKLKMANKKATRATPKKPQASKRKYIENMVVFYQ